MEAFADAAIRHCTDAELLEGHARLPNADHLYGIAAECTLKAALRVRPGQDSLSSLPSHLHKHINELWDRAPLQGWVQQRYPELVRLLRRENPFQDWCIAQRYETGSAITQGRVAAHKTAARRLLGVVGLLGTGRPHAPGSI